MFLFFIYLNSNNKNFLLKILNINNNNHMDNKEKKQMTIFKSVQITKDIKEKYFKVQRGDNTINTKNNCSANDNNGLLIKNNDNQDQTNQIFITHKDKQINASINHPSKKGNCQNNNNGIFKTTMDNSSINKKSLSNKDINEVKNNNKHLDESIYKKKLNLVYFESIKKLCNHLNHSFNQLIHKEKIVNINEYLTQMYQNLQILNKKIELITNKQSFHINKEDFEMLNILLNHLVYMNKTLNNNLSKNITDIYSNLNKFCNICICST
jgi:hypothetical protein